MGSQQQHHPEEIPKVAPLQKITIDLGNFSDVELDVDREHDAIAMRIDKLDRACTVGDIPVIKQLLKISTDPHEIRKLSQALEKIAGTLERWNDLNNLKIMIEMAKTKPNVLAAALGDFSSSLTDENTSLFLDDSLE